MTCHEPHYCVTSGDELFHMGARGRHESSSPLGQFVHDKLPRQFDWMDIDGAIYTMRHGLLRLVEQKSSDQRLSPSQSRVLPILAQGVHLLATSGLVAPGSGVFVVRGDVPFEEIRVQRITPILEAPRPPLMFENSGVLLTGSDRDRWLMGSPVVRTAVTS